MGVFQNNLMGAAAAAGSAAAGGFYTHQIANSCRFDRASSHYLSRTIQAGGDLRKWTLSFWVKQTPSAGFSGNQYHLLTSKLSSPYDTLMFDVSAGWFYYQIVGKYLYPANKLRDTSAWQHIVIIWDSDNGTAGARRKFYVNGVLTGDYLDEVIAINSDSKINSNSVHYIGARQDLGAAYFMDGYFADFIFASGYAYDPTYFGESKNGCWIPKDYKTDTGNYGTTGYHLDFASSSDLGNDVSGNNNDWTAVNLAPHDQMLDSPTFGSEGSANFCTFTPLTGGSTNVTFSEGNLKASTSSNIEGMICSFGIPIGSKFYWEMTQTGWSGSDGDDVNVGVNTLTQPDFQSNRGGNDTAYGYTCNTGAKVILGTESSYGDSFRTGDVIGIAIDRVNHTFQGYKNGVGQGTFSIASTGDLYPWIGVGGGFSESITLMNFGADSSFAGQSGLSGTSAAAADENGYGDFYDTPPSGFLALCAANLPTADAVDPAQTDDDYPQKLFQTILYTGNSGNDVTVTTKLKTDWFWAKARAVTDNHYSMDSTRVYGGSKNLSPNTNGYVGYNGGAAASMDITTTDSNIQIEGSDWTTNTYTYAAWLWRANGGTTSAGSGDLTSTHQVDPSGGFSIVKAVGDGGSGDKTVSHGLSATPTCILAKNLDSAYNWDTYFSEGVTAGSGMRLNTNETPFTGRWGTISSSIFTATDNYTWVGTDNYIYYCFTNIEGYIKSGKYEGNGNADGAFVYTGFRPAWIMTKSVDSTSAWHIFDNQREGYNVDNDPLEANATTVEATTDMIDILSNGFKLRIATDPNVAETYVYIAMAHNPFQYATAR